jgi:hypothetical protein
VPQALEIRVLVVKARIHFLDRGENAALLRFSVVAATRTCGIGIKIIVKAAAVALVEPGTSKLLRVLHVRGAAETNLL